MGFTTQIYQRPREKLQNTGIGSLSNVELLQVIIGSGNVRVSGATMARNVEKLIQLDRLNYQTLMTIHGIGIAKSCQILAAVEIGKRIIQNE
jgi:DNA repair protein RadC